jgi:hypothetical protein
MTQSLSHPLRLLSLVLHHVSPFKPLVIFVPQLLAALLVGICAAQTMTPLEASVIQSICVNNKPSVRLFNTDTFPNLNPNPELKLDQIQCGTLTRASNPNYEPIINQVKLFRLYPDQRFG